MILFCGCMAILSAGDSLGEQTGVVAALPQAPEAAPFGRLGPHSLLFAAMAWAAIITLMLWMFVRLSGGHL